MTTDARPLPTQEEVLGYFKSLSNWGRWGQDDERGTLNLITPEKVRQAAALVREGVSVSCARPITYDLGPGSSLVIHYMTGTGEAQVPGTPNVAGGSGDFFGIAPHGYTITHMDAHSHMFWEGYMYNGRPANLITARGGAVVGQPGADGLVGGGDLSHVGTLAQGVRQTLLAPAKVDGMDLSMNASVGITVREPNDVRAVDHDLAVVRHDRGNPVADKSCVDLFQVKSVNIMTNKNISR